LPPEYAKYVTIAISAAMGAIALYNLIIKPMMAAGASAKALLASKAENSSLKDTLNMNQEELEKMINDTFSKADRLLIESKITELKVKIPFADDDGKIELQVQIDKLVESLV
jgi:hypothetical protein